MRRKIITLKELLSRYAAGERDFTKIELTGPLMEAQDRYFKGVNLSGARFRGSDIDLIKLCMYGINLSRSDLRHLDLAYANLDRANLSGAYMSRACLWRASLRGANLSGVDLSRSDLQETNFGWANLSGANLSDAKIIDTYFGEANLSGADFRNAKLEGWINFADANLTRTNFFGADMGVTALDRSKIKNSIFRKAYFQDTIMPYGSIRYGRG